MLGLRFCARAFSSYGERGPLFIAVRGPLTVAASLVAEHRLQTCRLSSCCSQAQLLRGMWDLPRPGLEPVFPALAGRFSTTAPPGKPLKSIFFAYIQLQKGIPSLGQSWVMPLLGYTPLGHWVLILQNVDLRINCMDKMVETVEVMWCLMGKENIGKTSEDAQWSQKQEARIWGGVLLRS